MIKINGYPIDLALSEEFSAETEITEYPIETGANASDHMRNLPIELTFEGIVSDTPIGAAAVDPTRQGEGVKPSKDAYDRLVEIRNNREPVVIECSLGKFEKMGLANLSIPRSRTTGKSLHFTVTFREMNFITNNRTTVRVAIPNGKGRANLGNKESQEWGKNFNLPGKRFVVSKGTWQRATLLKAGTFGKPILTTTKIDRIAANGVDDLNGDQDHYEIKGGTNPDGYVDGYFGNQSAGEPLHNAGKLVYHRFTVVSNTNTTIVEHAIDGRPVEFDEVNKTWVDPESKEVVRGPMKQKTRKNPEETRAYEDEKWRGVTYGKNLPGGGITN